ncbi:hypothetical protein KKG31_06720 [Patescibacteria group bacterium]|nr:hypothetical protein [Patescibacteria group bacterium]MBU1758783.1 hypothetical protein [Patescibacteria group bacterium]
MRREEEKLAYLLVVHHDEMVEMAVLLYSKRVRMKILWLPISLGKTLRQILENLVDLEINIEPTLKI